MKRIVSALLGLTGVTAIASFTQAQEVDGCFFLDNLGQQVNVRHLCPELKQAKTNNYVQQQSLDDDIFALPITRRESGIPIIEVVFNGNHKYEMMLDTGASLTMITPQMAKAVSLKQEGVFIMTTPSDTSVHVPKGRISSVEAGGAVYYHLLVAVSKSLKVGLLGQNFFGNYDITIKKDLVEFRRRATDG
jgi:aspartyl protease family protein